MFAVFLKHTNMNEMVLIQKDELINLIGTVVASEIKKHNQTKVARPKIKGIHGLAVALGCSDSKAMQLKNSGKIRYFQDGKLLLFDYEQVIEDLKGQNITKRGRKSVATRSK